MHDGLRTKKSAGIFEGSENAGCLEDSKDSLFVLNYDLIHILER